MSFTFLGRTISAAGAFSDEGVMLCTLKPNGKYSMFMPVAGVPATGAAPNMLDITVTTDSREKQIPGRQAAMDIELTALNTLDNKIKFNKIRGTSQDFLLFYPDGSGYRFSGNVSGWADAVDLGSTPNLIMSVGVTRADDDFLINVLDLMEDIVTFETTFDARPYRLKVGGDPLETTVVTFPATATVAVESEAPSVATAAITAGKLTITGVAAGTTTIILTGSSTDYAQNFRAFNVVVTA